MKNEFETQTRYRDPARNLRELNANQVEVDPSGMIRSKLTGAYYDPKNVKLVPAR